MRYPSGMDERRHRAALRDLYGFEFPDDFFAFAAFAREATEEALWDLIGIRLEAPFRLVEPAWKQETPQREWAGRYYLDPPEFFTVLSGAGDGLHWGYYLDDPDNDPATRCVASYYSNDAFDLTEDGADLWDAVRSQLEHTQLSNRDYWGANDADERDETMRKTDALRTLLQFYGASERPEVMEAYTERDESASPRADKIVAPTEEGMGIVLPAELYRALPDSQTEAALRAILEPTDPQEIVKETVRDALQLARDGFPGAALQLGKDWWGIHPVAFDLLDAAYATLDRPTLRRFLQVARDYQAHCDVINAQNAARRAAPG